LEDNMVSEAERIRELEERLEHLEHELHRREGGHLSALLGALLPTEVGEHMRAACREQMLAVSAYLNHMAGKASEVADAVEDSGGSREHRHIPVE
jgi:hypothetical protein